MVIHNSSGLTSMAAMSLECGDFLEFQVLFIINESNGIDITSEFSQH